MKLTACSMDGSIKVLDLEDVGKMLSLKELGDICETKYGNRPKSYDDGFIVPATLNKRSQIIDDVDQWRETNDIKMSRPSENTHTIQSSFQRQPQNGSVESDMTASPNSLNAKPPSLPNGQAKRSVTNTQTEIRTKSGKRKITPMFLGPLESAPTTSFGYVYDLIFLLYF